jgi:prepilin-type processing-associated H-X9-DG protein
MHCDDSQDRLPYASESADPNSLPDAWVTGNLDYNPANQSNWNPDVNIKKSPLWKYCGNDLKIWKCPADQSYVVVNGVATPRVRSMAMNVYLGGWGGVAGGGELANWKFYLKTTDFAPVPPSRLFVLHDMRVDRINTGEFVTKMSGFSETSPSSNLYGFYDFPGMYHDGGGTFSFADGRVEIHRWRDRRTTPTLHPDGQVPDSFDSPRNPDVAWLQERATRPK